MRGNPGYICQIKDGGKCFIYHKEQEPQFAVIKKHFVHFMDDKLHPVLKEDGEPKTGLIASSKLSIIGFLD